MSMCGTGSRSIVVELGRPDQSGRSVAAEQDIDMTRTLLLVPAFAVALLGSTKIAKAQEYYGPRQYYYEQHEAERAWERQGFYDGVRGADRDFEKGRRPDVNNRHEYRDPRLPRWERHEYREGFRRGYYERVKQIYYGRQWRNDDDD